MNKNNFPFRFFIITFLWTWFFWGIVVFIGHDLYSSSGISLPLIPMGIFSPAIGACVSLYSINGKNSLKIFLKSFFSLNFGFKVWLLIFFGFSIPFVIAWFIPELFGVDRLSIYLSKLFISPVYLLIMIFFGGGQEEIGWRGYILSYLEKRFGLIFGSLIIGVIWAIWHIPLWFISGTNQSYMNFFAFTLMLVGWSYIFSWVTKLSANRLFSGLVIHGTGNTFTFLFPIIIREQNVKQVRFWIYSILILLIGIIIVVIRTYKNRKTVHKRS